MNNGDKTDLLKIAGLGTADTRVTGACAYQSVQRPALISGLTGDEREPLYFILRGVKDPRMPFDWVIQVFSSNAPAVVNDDVTHVERERLQAANLQIVDDEDGSLRDLTADEQEDATALAEEVEERGEVLTPKPEDLLPPEPNEAALDLPDITGHKPAPLPDEVLEDANPGAWGE